VVTPQLCVLPALTLWNVPNGVSVIWL
jgi:hypothetical protein